VKFKLDENLPIELLNHLISLGHDVDTVLTEGLKGAADPDVVKAAFEADRILFTLDKGIANVKRYPGPAHAGVVLFRPSETGRGSVFLFIKERLKDLLEMDLKGRTTVVGSTGIRFR
jgi:predicted nuclease of predicted toxin-antitoxin system